MQIQYACTVKKKNSTPGASFLKNPKSTSKVAEVNIDLTPLPDLTFFQKLALVPFTVLTASKMLLLDAIEYQ